MSSTVSFVQKALQEAQAKAWQNNQTPASLPAGQVPGHLNFLSATLAAANLPPNSVALDSFSDADLVEYQMSRPQTTDPAPLAYPYEKTEVFYSASDICSGAYDHVEMPTCFANPAQARLYRRAQCQPVPASTDTTLPQNAKHLRMLVHTMFQAFKSIELAEDNPKYVNQFKNENHNAQDVEAALWRLLRCLRKRSTVDGPLQRAFYGKMRDFERHQYQNFAERFDAVIYTLAHNKSECKAILEAPNLEKLADDPMYRKQKSDSNRKINNSKAGKNIVHNPTPVDPASTIPASTIPASTIPASTIPASTISSPVIPAPVNPVTIIPPSTNTALTDMASVDSALHNRAPINTAPINIAPQSNTTSYGPYDTFPPGDARMGAARALADLRATYGTRAQIPPKRQHANVVEDAGAGAGAGADVSNTESRSERARIDGSDDSDDDEESDNNEENDDDEDD